ncbi:hypothetical protein LTS08_004348 [Lithohypha guttulata]|nr:hypothetical protein LTS08_004348 [Lithohypha guttulata]
MFKFAGLAVFCISKVYLLEENSKFDVSLSDAGELEVDEVDEVDEIDEDKDEDEDEDEDKDEDKDEDGLHLVQRRDDGSVAQRRRPIHPEQSDPDEEGHEAAAPAVEGTLRG